MQSSQHVTYAEAAEILNRTIAAVRHLVSYGKLHAIKVKGSRVRFLDRAEVERYARGEKSAQTPAPNASAPGVALQASTLAPDDKATLATMGDKFIALAVAIASAIAPALRDSYTAFFQFKTAEATAGGPLDDAMRQIKRSMEQAALQADQEGITENVLSHVMGAMMGPAEQTMGPAGPAEKRLQDYMTEGFRQYAKDAGAYTTTAEASAREYARAS